MAKMLSNFQGYSVVKILIVCSFLVSTTKGQCGLLSLLTCESQVQTLVGDLSSAEFPFTVNDLNMICDDYAWVVSCLASIGCSVQDFIAEYDGNSFLGAYNLGSYICGDAETSITANISCYDQVGPAQTAIANCINQTQPVYTQLSNINPCGIVATEASCYEAVLPRYCSSGIVELLNAANTQFSAIKYSCNISQTYGPCDESRIQACTASMFNYVNTKLNSVTFSNANLFNGACNYVDWTSACLNAFGCNSSVLNDWLKFQPALTNLCFSNSQLALSTFSSSTCESISQCTAIPESSATLISNCPFGFTINATQSVCPLSIAPISVPAQSTILTSFPLRDLIPTALTKMSSPLVVSTIMTRMSSPVMASVAISKISSPQAASAIVTQMSFPLPSSAMTKMSSNVLTGFPMSSSIVTSSLVKKSSVVPNTQMSTSFTTAPLLSSLIPGNVVPGMEQNVNRSLDSGSIVAIVISIVLGICLLTAILAVIIILLRRRRSLKKPPPTPIRSSSVIGADNQYIFGALPPSFGRIEFKDGFNYASLKESDSISALHGEKQGVPPNSESEVKQPIPKDGNVNALSQQEEIYFDNGKNEQIGNS